MGQERIEGVLFDAGNTLIRVRGSVGGVYGAVARRHGVEGDAAVLEARFRQVFARRRAGFLAGVSHPHSPERERAWWRALVAEVWQGAGGWGAPDSRFDAYFDDLYREFADPRHWEVFADVGPCLDALAARGVPAAVVSNWDSRLHPVLDGLGLAARFRFVLTSAEFGAEKPHPSIFREAARRLGLAPARLLHVGDSPGDDVAGAQGAGLAAVLVVRDGAAAPPGCPVVWSLGEVPALVG